MLTISPEATQAIRQLCDEAELPDSGGMRIARGPDTEMGAAVELALVEAPASDDHVIEGPGASVYVDEQLAALLDDKVLDAQLAEGQVTFALRQDPTPPAASMNGRAS